MIYLDSSAILKLLFDEPESAALERWLSARTGTPAISSQIAKIEVLRSCRRLDANALAPARALLAGLDLVPLTTDIVDEAGNVGDALLRSLDAIHLASALSIRADLTAFIAYDHRLAEAASGEGLVSVQPR